MILLPFRSHKSTLQISPCPLPCPDYITGDLYLEMFMYNLAQLLLLAPILIYTTSASLISTLVKAWDFCMLTIEANYQICIN
jgi:hypothetical protein